MAESFVTQKIRMRVKDEPISSGSLPPPARDTTTEHSEPRERACCLATSHSTSPCGSVQARCFSVVLLWCFWWYWCFCLEYYSISLSLSLCCVFLFLADQCVCVHVCLLRKFSFVRKVKRKKAEGRGQNLELQTSCVEPCRGNTHRPKEHTYAQTVWGCLSFTEDVL